MEIRFQNASISPETRQPFVIAEIGHNHRGSLETALQMIRTAAQCGAHAVKFQKRQNRSLYTRAMYEQPYEHEHSYGDTYGSHRERLEFGIVEYRQLKKEAESCGIEFMCAPFDFESVDFLDELDVGSFKFASADLTNIPLLQYAASRKKPLFISTGAATWEEIDMAYDAIRKLEERICLLHCVCEYPAEYDHLNLNAVAEMKKRYPEAIIGYSGHDNGILAAAIAYQLGARVFEKHFTLNHAWKGTDHAFSLEPEGLRKQVRDLERISDMLGDGQKIVHDYEMPARRKMGKSLYAARPLPAGYRLTENDIVIKSPGGFLPPYQIQNVIGQVLVVAVDAEAPLGFEMFKGQQDSRQPVEGEADVLNSGSP